MAVTVLPSPLAALTTADASHAVLARAMQHLRAQHLVRQRGGAGLLSGK